MFYRRHERMVLGFYSAPRRCGVCGGSDRGDFAAALIGVRRFDPARGPAAAGSSGSGATSSAAPWRRARRGSRAAAARDAADRVGGGGDHPDRAPWRRRARGRAAGQIPADQAQAVRARIVEELPYKVIAAEVRCSESVIRQRVSRGLATLRSIAKDRRERTATARSALDDAPHRRYGRPRGGRAHPARRAPRGRGRAGGRGDRRHRRGALRDLGHPRARRAPSDATRRRVDDQDEQAARLHGQPAAGAGSSPPRASRQVWPIPASCCPPPPSRSGSAKAVVPICPTGR